MKTQSTIVTEAQLKKTLIELLKIDEVYPHEKEVIEYVENWFQEIGVEHQRDSFKNVIAKIPGKGEPVMLSTHMDIPEPVPNLGYTEDGDVIKSDGKGILGVDPKSGLASLLEFAKFLAKKDKNTHCPVEIVLTRGEESSLQGAKNLDYSLVESKMGLVLDEDGPINNVVTKAPCIVLMDAYCKGVPAHPRDPSKGKNALQAIADVFAKMPWGHSTEGVTWNVGKLEAGTARNTIPGHVYFKGELRSFDQDLAKKEGERLKKIFKETCSKHSVDCELEPVLESEEYELTSNHDLFKRLETSFKELGMSPNYYETFGASDANVFNARGIKTVPVGSAYYNAHQYSEYANIKEMKEVVDFLNIFCSA